MDMIKKPKIWLVVLALMHTFMGVIGSYVQMGGDTEHLAVILYFLSSCGVPASIFYSDLDSDEWVFLGKTPSFMTEGQRTS